MSEITVDDNALYEFLQKNQSKDQFKVQFGYTIDSYKGVFAELEKARLKIIRQSGAAGGSSGGTIMSSDSYTTVWKRWTQLSSFNIGTLTSDGFIVDSKGNAETYRRMVVQCLPYYAIPINVKNNQGKSVAKILFGKNPQDSSFSAFSGITFSGGNKQEFLNRQKNFKKSDFIDGLGSQSNPFKVGIMSDFKNDVLKFFKKCFPKITGWEADKLMVLAERGILFCEVAFSSGEMQEYDKNNEQFYQIVKEKSLKSQAIAINIKVIGNLASSNGGNNKIYFPVPILCLSQFQHIGSIEVSVASEKQEDSGELFLLGGDKVTSPLRSSYFDPEKSEIDGYTPELMERFKTNNQAMVIDEGTSKINFKSYVVGDKRSNSCYVRYFFKKGSQSDVQKEFGAIPSEYKTQLFKGAKEMVTRQRAETISGTSFGGKISGGRDDTPYYGEGQVDWDKLAKNPNKKKVCEYKEIWEQMARKYNINLRFLLSLHAHETGWAESEAWNEFNNPGGLLSNNKRLKYDKFVPQEQFGGILAARKSSGTGDGKFFEFKTKQDGIEAKCYILVNSSHFGLKKRQYKSIGYFFAGLKLGDNFDANKSLNEMIFGNERGHFAYCPDEDYAERLIEIYENSF